MTGAAPISFDQLLHRLPKTGATVSGPDISLPSPVHPFVPQRAIVDQAPASTDPLDSDIVLLTAPAAVGKSTFAKALAGRSQVPFLDLALVPVSTHSLRGIISAAIGPNAAEDLQDGKLSIIVDALDEGRIVSGDRNFEEFLRTAFQLLLEKRRAGASSGPRLLLFGRGAAIDIASIILELHAGTLPVTRLTIDYFDEKSATELVLEYARIAGGSEKVRRFEIPIRETISAFFAAIGAAIGTTSDSLWKEAQGRSFAGYAPVLAALGALIGDEDNYATLRQRFRATGLRDAWSVLEQVADQVLSRETPKVNGPLSKTWGSAVPQEAYDSVDQLDLLTGVLAGRPVQQSARLHFASPDAAAAYREAVKQHLPEHAFLREGKPVNAVLGSLILSHAITTGALVLGGQVPSLLADYGRQPFLWRFLQRRAASAAVVGGDLLPYILGSLWSDERATSGTVSVAIAGSTTGVPRLTVRLPSEMVAVDLVPPVHLRGELGDITVDLPGEEVVMDAWFGKETRSIRCLGAVEIRAGAIRFEISVLYVGALPLPATCHLEADEAIGDQLLTFEIQRNSRLTVAGIFKGRYPWDSVASPPVKPRTDDQLWNLLNECEQRLPGALPVVVFEDYELTDDLRVAWARKYGKLFPRLVRELVQSGLARTTGFDSSGAAPKKRVRPDFPWLALKRAYEGIGEYDTRLSSVLTRFLDTNAS